MRQRKTRKPRSMRIVAPLCPSPYLLTHPCESSKTGPGCVVPTEPQDIEQPEHYAAKAKYCGDDLHRNVLLEIVEREGDHQDQTNNIPLTNHGVVEYRVLSGTGPRSLEEDGRGTEEFDSGKNADSGNVPEKQDAVFACWWSWRFF